MSRTHPCALMLLLVLALLAQPARAALEVQNWTTPGGTRVLFVESRALPIVDVSIEFPAGSSRDEPAVSRLANLTLQMLRLGSRARGEPHAPTADPALTEDEVALRLADVGAQLSSTFDVDRAGYSLRTLSSARERAQALDVLAAVVQRPAFPPEVVAREKERVIAGLREAAVKPNVVAQRAFAQLVFGEHPYALRLTGELESVAALQPEQLAQFHRTHYLRDRAVISIIGDLDRSEAERIAHALSDGLPLGESEAGDPPPSVASLAEPVQRYIAHDAAQAHVIVGAPGMRRSDPDYFPLLVGNYILGGGGFNSRLTVQVRERRGLTYSVYSAFYPYLREGAFAISLQTRKDQADEALNVVRDTLARFVSEGPTEAELDGARQHLVGAFPLRIDSNRKLLDYLAVIGYYGLPMDWLDRFPERVSEVTLAQIRDAFRRRVDPARMATVVVGGTPPSAQP